MVVAKDVRFTDDSLMRRVLRRSADHCSHQGIRQDAGLADIIASLAITGKSAVGVGEAVIDLDVEGIFRNRARRVVQKIVGRGCSRNVRSRILMVKIQNVRAGLVDGRIA